MAFIEDSGRQAAGKRLAFWRRHGTKATAVLLWGGLLAAYGWYTSQNDVTARESAAQLARALASGAWGPALYVGLYAVRPLLFFPATLLTVLGGFLFGPAAGVVYTVIGSNSSALLAFFVGRFFGRGVLDSEDASRLIERYAARLRANSFEAVLIMRLLFLPYDLVHYVAGFLGIDWKAFLLATAIGSIPGTISFVLLGASFGTLDGLLEGAFSLNPWTLALSVGLIVLSLGISRLVRRREQQRAEQKEQG